MVLGAYGLSRGGAAGGGRRRLEITATVAGILGMLGGSAAAQTGESVQLREIVVDGANDQGGGNGGPAGKSGPTNGPTGVKGYTATNASVATKTNTPLEKVPASVSVVTRENLNDRNVQDLNTALAYTPGASTSVFGYDPRFEDIYIRGFDTIYNGVYRDGLRDQNAAGAGAIFRNEPYGFDAITILRGPAAATYGYGSPGGIVDITSKRPIFARFGEVQLQFGNYDRKQGNFDFGDVVPQTDGKLAYRMTGVIRDADTFPSGPDDRISLAPAFTYQPDGATSFTFLSGYDKVRVPGTVAFFNTGKPNYEVTNIRFGDPAYNKLVQEQYRIGYALEHKFADDLTFRQNFRFARLDLNWRYTTVDSIINGGTEATRSNGLLLEKQGTVAVDNQVEKRFTIGPTHHVLLAGLDYTHADFSVRSGFGFSTAFGGNVPNLDLRTLNYGQQFIPDPALSNALSYDQRQDQLGEYLQDQIDLGPASLTLSGRHDTVDSTTVNYNTALPANQQYVKQVNDGFTGRAGLNYKVAPGVVPYISYATTFAPNLGVATAGATAGQPFPVQRGDQKEVGIKTQVPKTDLHFNAAAFEIIESSVIRTAGMLAFAEATGKVRSAGYEFETIYNIAPGTNVMAQFTHFDLTYLDNSYATLGHRLSGIPGDTVSGWAATKIPGPGAWRGLDVGAGVRYYGWSFTDDDNFSVNHPAAFFDAVVGYDFGVLAPNLRGVRAQVNAYNVLNTYSTTCQAGFCYRRAPLQVIGSLIYRW